MMRFPAPELEIVADPPTTMPPVGPALQASDPQSRSAVVDISRMREFAMPCRFSYKRPLTMKKKRQSSRGPSIALLADIGRQGAVTRERRLQADAKSASCRGGLRGRSYPA